MIFTLKDKRVLEGHFLEGQNPEWDARQEDQNWALLGHGHW